MENGTRFPPIIVFFDIENEIYILGDGFHRLFAHLRAKPNDPIIVEQYLGNVQDAQWYSIGANKSHGLKRSNEDKRNAVELAFLHPKSATMSDRQVADHVGVSYELVSTTRKRLVHEGRLSESDSRVGKDGRTYKITNIGRASAETHICGGCDHYESPRCTVEGVVRAPTEPACDEFEIREDDGPDTVEDMVPEIRDPGYDDEYIPKVVRHRVGRLKPGKYVRVPLSVTDTDHAAAEIRHYFDENYLAALAQSAIKLLKESKSL